MKANFTIPVAPVGKGRPRLCGFSVYTPAKTKAYENYVKACYVEQCGDLTFKDSPLVVFINAFMPIPTKFKKAEREQALNNKLKPDNKPDVDNIQKTILDALNELAYDDDRYIYKISVERFYSEHPRTEILLIDSEEYESKK